MNVEDRESQAVFFYGNMKKQTKIKTKLSVPNRPDFYIKLTIADKIYEAETNTILEALESLRLDNFIKGKGILKVKKGKLETEILLWPRQLKRLMMNKIYRAILQKRLLNSLK